MTDTLEAQDLRPQAPPSYEELMTGTEVPDDNAKGDFKVDAKTASADVKADTTTNLSSQPSSSSSQLFASAQSSRIKDPRSVNLETWPGLNGKPLRIDAVYGFYLETVDMYGGAKKIKITDYNGGVLFHFSFTTSPSKVFGTGHVWSVPGDEVVVPAPKSSWRFPKLSAANPTPPDTYAWKHAYNRPSELECIDGRISYVTFNCWECEGQVWVRERLPMRRDSIEFTVPTARGDAPGRTFVWLCGTIMRNRNAQRWDEGVYVLHEKGDLTKQYGSFEWRQDFAIRFRELPDVLEHEHPLLLYTLSHLILAQFGQCAKWPPASYEQSGFSKDPTRLSFNVAALQKRAAEWLGPRYMSQ